LTDANSFYKGASRNIEVFMSHSINRKIVGRVVNLWRYPVKSMAPEALNQVDVSWHGLSGDRRWAFVRDEAVKSDFPWLTIRERNDLNHYKPSFIDEKNPDKSDTQVMTPSGGLYNITDPALAHELYPNGTRVIKQNRGIFDTFPLSLITTQTIKSLNTSTGTELAPERFRPNFLVEAIDDEPYPEDCWIGKTLCIGNLRIRMDKRDSRCVVITIDPLTTEKNTEVLKYVYQQRQGCLGIYGTTEHPGIVALNDKVILEN
jgi:uncharacterized protein YcbX